MIQRDGTSMPQGQRRRAFSDFFMKLLVILLISLAVAPAVFAGPSPADPQNLPILPNTFAGWEISGSVRKGIDAGTIDHAQNAALREYGFTGYEIATYSQGKRKLTVRAARFQDATGAYGAFTFYRVPGTIPERIGNLAASDNERVLFFRGAVLVEARFVRVTAMSASELRELAAALPSVDGPAANLPVLPNYLPKDKITPNSAKYVLGPAAYASLALPIPDSIIDFGRKPEILTGKIAQQGHNRLGLDVLENKFLPRFGDGKNLRRVQIASLAVEQANGQRNMQRLLGFLTRRRRRRLPHR